MFSKTRGKLDTFVNDRVTAPVRTAVMISCAAFLIAGLALILATRKAAAACR